MHSPVLAAALVAAGVAPCAAFAPGASLHSGMHLACRASALAPGLLMSSNAFSQVRAARASTWARSHRLRTARTAQLRWRYDCSLRNLPGNVRGCVRASRANP